MSSRRRLLVATTNRKKLAELRTLLAPLGLELVCLGDLEYYQEVPEDGETFEANARLKALGYAKQTGLFTLAEDSGFCCDALDGAPGVCSARFAGPSKEDLENNKKLLKLLEKVPDENRGAYFKSVVAIAEPGQVIGVVQGEVRGFVSREIRGMNGFGYDPVFFYPPYQNTFAEVPSEMKHQVSHRAKALEKAKELLRQYLKEI